MVYPKDLYQVAESPSLVVVPPLKYIALDGEGGPNDDSYASAVTLLKDLAVLLGKETMSFIECVWTAIETENKETWTWSAMIAEPQNFDEQRFIEARDQIAFKEGLSTQDIYRTTLEEGLCVTMMHYGSFSFEGQSFSIMESFCKKNRLQRIGNTHREIYLDTPNHETQDDLKTILRFQVERI